MVAYAQGDLDGFCGIYSVVHAYLQLLEVKTDREYDEDLFRVACNTIPRAELINYLCDGIDFEQLLKIARKVSRHFRDTHGFEIEVSSPFAGRRFKHRDDFFAEISDLWSSRYCSFVIGIEWPASHGGGGHWTVLKEIKDDKLRLIDSSRKQTLPLRALGVSGTRGTRLTPRETLQLTLTRIDGEKLFP